MLQTSFSKLSYVMRIVYGFLSVDTPTGMKNKCTNVLKNSSKTVEFFPQVHWSLWRLPSSSWWIWRSQVWCFFFYLQTIIVNSLQVISPLSTIRSTNTKAFEVTSSVNAALAASALALLMKQGKSPLGVIQFSLFPLYLVWRQQL